MFLPKPLEKAFENKPVQYTIVAVIGIVAYVIFTEVGVPAFNKWLYGDKEYAYQREAYVKIKRIDVLESNYVNLFVSGLPEDILCTYRDRIVIHPKSDGAKTMTSTAHASLMLERNIMITIGECTSISKNSEATAPKILRVSLSSI